MLFGLGVPHVPPAAKHGLPRRGLRGFDKCIGHYTLGEH